MYFFFVTNHCYVACLYDFTSVVMQMLQRNGDPLPAVSWVAHSNGPSCDCLTSARAPVLAVPQASSCCPAARARAWWASWRRRA